MPEAGRPTGSRDFPLVPRVFFFGLRPLAFGLPESLQKNATMTALSKRMPVAASAVLEKFQSNRPVRHIAPLLTSSSPRAHLLA